MTAPVTAAQTSPALVLNGYPLAWRHMGTGAYTLRIIQALLRYAAEIDFRVILPANLKDKVEDLPEDKLLFLEGRPPINRAMAIDIYWNCRIGAHAATNYPDSVFHAPREFWSLARPKKRVVTVHDCTWRFFPRLQGGLLRKWWWRATERYARNATIVLTVSEASKRDLVSLARVPEPKVKVLYPWIDADEFRFRSTRDADSVRAKYRLPGRFFLYFGGFNINKNVEFLIEAYAAATRRATLPPLVVAGSINENLRLAVCDVRGAIRKSGLSKDQIITPGFIAEEEVPGLMGAADLLVFPSRYEGFGYPPVEAMAAGTPVLVSDLTSLPEVVRNPDCRFSLGDTALLTAKLIQASKNPSLFHCDLPPEFTPDVGIGLYLSMSGLNVPGQALPR